jgi:glycosyltransferase involved in cell wall biosynthesis
MEDNKKEMNSEPRQEISVIVPVIERYGDLEELYLSYAKEFKQITSHFEFIFIVDGPMGKASSDIKKFMHKYENVELIKFTKSLGESNALSVGYEMSRGKYIFTLSSYFQVEPDEIKKLYSALKDDSADIVITRRMRGKDTFFNKLQNTLFHRALKIFTGTNFKDISCGLRGMKRDVFEKFDVYGDLHRFIPIIAEYHGVKVRELKVKQRKEDTKTRIYSLRTYLNRIIDILTLFFLLRFTYRPMRFFGLIGSILVICGFLFVGKLIYFRLFTENYGLTDKPSLFLSSLLIVIGIQIFAVGLIGEIIIYTRSKKARYFNIKEFIE